MTELVNVSRWGVGGSGPAEVGGGVEQAGGGQRMQVQPGGQGLCQVDHAEIRCGVLRLAANDVVDHHQRDDHRQQHLEGRCGQDEQAATGEGQPVRLHPLEQAPEQARVQHRAGQFGFEQRVVAPWR